MAYQNEMQDIQKVMEVVRPYPQVFPPNTGEPIAKAPQDVQKSHKNTHDK